jgi:hypothetical protein
MGNGVHEEERMSGPFLVGEENHTDARTDLIVADGVDYWTDVVLRILVPYSFVQKQGQHIDAIRCRGSKEINRTEDISGNQQLTTHGRAGNGIVATGLNGVVGYVHGIEPDPEREGAAQAGVFGFGGPDHPGVIGRGQDGVIGLSDANDRSGVYGFNSQAAGAAWGVFGQCDSPDGAGVGAICGAAPGVRCQSSGNDGVVGISDSSNRSGVFGFSSVREGKGFGVLGRTVSSKGAGVCGENEAAGDGVSGFSRDGAGVSGTSQKHNGVVGRTGVVNASGVYGENSRDPFADQDVERGRGDAMFGQPIDWQIVGVMGRANSAAGTGVKGASSNGDGVTGIGGRYGAVLGGQVAPVRLSPAAHPGAPTSGYHRMGELYVDNEGDLFFCKKSGTPGIWKQVA